MSGHWTLGDDYRNPSPLDWVKAARQHLADARIMLATGSYQSAYMSAGMCIEMALKARIMHSERLNQWPSRRSRPDLHVHKLGSLLQVSGLRADLEREYAALSDVGLAWVVVKDFDINVRYPTSKPFPKPLAEDYVEAVGDLGRLEWLTIGIS